MTSIFALRQRKVDLRKAAAAISEAASNRNLTPAEQASYNEHLKAIEANERELVAEEKRLAEMANEPHFEDENAGFARMANGQPLPGDPTKQRGILGGKWEQLFGRPPKSAFGTMGEFVRSVGRAHMQYDPRLTIQAAASESQPSNAGFLVPQEFSQQVFDQSLEGEVVRPRAMVYPMKSNSLEIPAVRDDDHSGGVLFGGMASGWSDELEDLDDASMEVRMLELVAKKFGLLTQASNELVSDSVYEAVLTQKFIAGCRWHLDEAFLWGSGAGQPLGCLSPSNPSLLVVAKETQDPDTIVFDNLAKMYAAMHPAGIKNAVWLVSTGAVPKLLRLQLNAESGAGSNIMLTVNSDGSMSMLTRPMIVTEHLKPVGDQGDIALVDLSQYGIGMRKDIRMDQSSHLGFRNDSTYFRLICRVDGQPLWDSKQKLKNNVYVSPFCVLEAR